jgi:hypothetical protein
MSRFMTTCAPSTLPLFDETELPPMSSAEAGLAKTSAQRAQALAWTEHAADYGPKSPEYLATFDPDGRCWKTAQTCLGLTGDLTLAAFSGTWPRSGTMSNGIASRLQPLTHPTSVIASGLWRTGEELLPTLTKADGMGGPGRSAKRKGGDNLRTAVLLPTLTARDWRSGKASPETMARNSRPLNETVVAELLPTLTATRRSGLQSHGKNAILGSLNPTWCEWYMGLPIGWSALEPSETSTPRSSPNSSAARSSKRKD